MAKRKTRRKDYEPWDNNVYLDRLYEHLLGKNTLLKQVLDDIDVDEKTFFNSAGHYFSKTDTKNQRPILLSIIRKLYLACNINPEDFLVIEKEEEYKNSKKRLFTSTYWNSIKKRMPEINPLTAAINIPHEKSENTKLKRAYKQIAPYFRKAEHRILSFELLFKGNNLLPGQLTSYKKAQGKIYKAIEATLKRHKRKGEKFKYIRILSLSQSEKYFPKKTDEDLKTAMAFEASKETLAHIKWCLDNYPEYCHFYVTDTSRFRHHCLIDNNWLLSEDYVLEQDSIVPDCIFVDNLTQNRKIKKVKRAFENHYNTLPRKVPIARSCVEGCLLDAHNFLGERIRQRDKNIEDISGQFRVGNIPNNIQVMIDKNGKFNDTLDEIRRQMRTKAINIGFIIPDQKSNQ